MAAAASRILVLSLLGALTTGRANFVTNKTRAQDMRRQPSLLGAYRCTRARGTHTHIHTDCPFAVARSNFFPLALRCPRRSGRRPTLTTTTTMASRQVIWSRLVGAIAIIIIIVLVVVVVLCVWLWCGASEEPAGKSLGRSCGPESFFLLLAFISLTKYTMPSEFYLLNWRPTNEQEAGTGALF